MNQLSQDIVDEIQLEAKEQNLEFEVLKRTDNRIIFDNDDFFEALSEKSIKFLSHLRDLSNSDNYYFADYLKLLSTSELFSINEPFKKNNFFVDQKYLNWIEKNSIKKLKEEFSLPNDYNYFPQDWLKYETGIKYLSKDYISENILKVEYVSKTRLDYGLVQLIYKHHGFDCATAEFWKNFQTKRNNLFTQDFYFSNSEDKNDFIDLIIDIENKFCVKKEMVFDTLRFRDLSKAKYKDSVSHFMIRLISATDTVIILEGKKFFNLIQGTNNLFNFLSDFYKAMIDYDSLIIKDEDYDKIINAIKALSELK